MKRLNSTANSEMRTKLKKIYLPNPLIRYMARQPLRIALIVHVAGFWSLFLSNWLNGSLVWSSPRLYDYTFLSSPFDWLYIGLLLPGGFWALAHYYRSLHEGIERLIDEGVIKTACIEKLIADWKTRKVLRSFLCGLRYILPLVFIVFMWQSFPSWCPSGKTTWFMNQDRTPHLIGYLLLFLAGIETLIVFAYVIDTVRLAFFHHYLVHQEGENGFPSIGFFPQHPDGAFGYGLLAPSMNWAGIFGLFSLTIIIIAIVCKVAIVETTREGLMDPLLVTNSLLCFVFFPWGVLGPVSPFIVMLFRRKREYLFSLRARLAEKISEMSHSTEGNSTLKGWERVAKGRPYIMERKSIFIIVASILLTQIIRVSGVLLSLARINLGL